MSKKLSDNQLRTLLNDLVNKAKHGPTQLCMKCNAKGWIKTVATDTMWNSIGKKPCECLNVDSLNFPIGTPYV
jgi:hypothetical protein